MEIDFSVVIPTFRRPELLAEALASVLRQRDVTLEIIVVDDSPEGSAEHLVKGMADARIKYLKNPHPSGGVPSAVRNMGWPLARDLSYTSSMTMISCSRITTGL